MSNYNTMSLKKLIAEWGESKVRTALSSFCSLNKDVEKFIRHDAVEFAKQHIAQTFLVFVPSEGKDILVGYYTLAMKMLHVERTDRVPIFSGELKNSELMTPTKKAAILHRLLSLRSVRITMPIIID